MSNITDIDNDFIDPPQNNSHETEGDSPPVDYSHELSKILQSLSDLANISETISKSSSALNESLKSSSKRESEHVRETRRREDESRRQDNNSDERRLSIFDRMFKVAERLNLYSPQDSQETSQSPLMDRLTQSLGQNNTVLGDLSASIESLTNYLSEYWQEIGQALTAKYILQSSIENGATYGEMNNKFGALGDDGSYETTASKYGRWANGFSFEGWMGLPQLVKGELADIGADIGESTDVLSELSSELAKSNRFTSTKQLTDTIRDIGNYAKVTGQSMESIRDYYIHAQREYGRTSEETSHELWETNAVRDKMLSSMEHQLKLQRDSGKLSEDDYQLSLDKLASQQEYFDGLVDIMDLLEKQGISVKKISKSYATNLKYLQQMGYAGRAAVEAAKKMTEALHDSTQADPVVKMLGGKKIVEGLQSKYAGMSSKDIEQDLEKSGKLKGTAWEGKSGELANFIQAAAATKGKGNEAALYEEAFDKLGAGDSWMTSITGVSGNQKVVNSLTASGIQSSADALDATKQQMFAESMNTDIDTARNILGQLRDVNMDVSKYEAKENEVEPTEEELHQSKKSAEDRVEDKADEYWLSHMSEWAKVQLDELTSQTALLTAILAALSLWKMKWAADNIKSIRGAVKANGGVTKTLMNEAKAFKEKGTLKYAKDLFVKGKSALLSGDAAPTAEVSSRGGKSIFETAKNLGKTGLNKLGGVLGDSSGTIGGVTRKLLPHAAEGVAGLKNAASVAAKGVPLLGNALVVGSEVMQYGSDDRYSTGEKALKIGGGIAGNLAGMAVGGQAGAALGTLVLPGIGTAVGGAAGGIVGGILGDDAADKITDWMIKTEGTVSDISEAASETYKNITDTFSKAGDWIENIFSSSDSDKINKDVQKSLNDTLENNLSQTATGIAQVVSQPPSISTDTSGLRPEYSNVSQGSSSDAPPKVSGGVKTLNSTNGKLVIEVPNFGSQLNKYNAEQEQYSWWKLW